MDQNVTKAVVLIVGVSLLGYVAYLLIEHISNSIPPAPDVNSIISGNK